MKSSNQKKKIFFHFNFLIFQFTRVRRSFFKYQRNYLSQNIVFDLVLKTVYWTMFSLNAIGLEKKCLNEIVQSEKKIFFHFNFLIFQFTRVRRSFF